MPTVTERAPMGSPVQQTIANQQQPAIIKESPKEPQATDKPLEDTGSKQFAALARSQKIFRDQQRAFQEQKKAFESQMKDMDNLKSQSEQFSNWKQRLAQDPYNVMLESGLTSDQVTSLLLNQPDSTGQKLSLIEQELKSTKEELSRLKSGQEQSQNEGLASAKKQMLFDVKQIVQADDSFEAIKANGEDAEQAVVELIHETYNQEGYIMDAFKAAQEVEEHLIEEAMKFANLKKVRAKLTPAQQVHQQIATPQARQAQQTSTTLSNRSNLTTKPLTDRERRERAVLAFQGKLA